MFPSFPSVEKSEEMESIAPENNFVVTDVGILDATQSSPKMKLVQEMVMLSTPLHHLLRKERANLYKGHGARMPKLNHHLILEGRGGHNGGTSSQELRPSGCMSGGWKAIGAEMG